MVTTMLQELDLQIDLISGEERKNYSFRHYYAMMRILDGLFDLEVASLLGNSATMVQKHDSHFRSEMRKDQYTGANDTIRAFAADVAGITG